MPVLSIDILVTGQDSVLSTVLRNCAEGTVAGRVVGVASNQNCPALAVGRSAQVPLVRAFPIEDDQSRSDRHAVMGAALREAGVNLVMVGGYNESLELTFFGAVGSGVDVISMYP